MWDIFNGKWVPKSSIWLSCNTTVGTILGICTGSVSFILYNFIASTRLPSVKIGMAKILGEVGGGRGMRASILPDGFMLFLVCGKKYFSILLTLHKSKKRFKKKTICLFSTQSIKLHLKINLQCNDSKIKTEFFWLGLKFILTFL